MEGGKFSKKVQKEGGCRKGVKIGCRKGGGEWGRSRKRERHERGGEGGELGKEEGGIKKKERGYMGCQLVYNGSPPMYSKVGSSLFA